MTDNIVFETDGSARGRYRAEVWNGERWRHVGQGYGYDDLGVAKQIASYHAWQWGDKTRVIDTQPETMAVDAHNGAQDATPAETRTSTGEGSRTRLETAHSEPTSKPCESDMDEYQTMTGTTAIYPANTVTESLDYLIPALAAAAPHLRAAWEQEMAEKIRAKFLGPDFGRNPMNGQDSPDAALRAAYDEGLQTALDLLEGGAE